MDVEKGMQNQREGPKNEPKTLFPRYRKIEILIDEPPVTGQAEDVTDMAM